MNTASAQPTDVQSIAPLTPAENSRFALDELQAFLSLLARVAPEDWDKPTPCTLWSVRDVVAHQAAHVQMGSGLRGFMAQANPLANRGYRKSGMSINDALNQAQVEMRRDRPIESVITELREGTPGSIASREHLAWPVRHIPVPVPPAGMMPLADLLRQIFPRDMWVHRLDIADATGLPFEQTPEHDGVMLAQAVADAARHLRKHEPAIPARLTLRGPAGGTWMLSPGPRPTVLEMDATDFMRRASGRASVAQTLPRVGSGAEPATLSRVLEALQAPF